MAQAVGVLGALGASMVSSRQVRRLRAAARCLGRLHKAHLFFSHQDSLGFACDRAGPAGCLGRHFGWFWGKGLLVDDPEQK